MRRFDKLKNIHAANLLVEQRYLVSKGLLKENQNPEPIGMKIKNLLFLMVILIDTN